MQKKSVLVLLLGSIWLSGCAEVNNSTSTSSSSGWGISIENQGNSARLTTVIPSNFGEGTAQSFVLDSVPWGKADGRRWTQTNSFVSVAAAQWDVSAEYWYSWWLMDALSIHRKNLKDPRTLSLEDPILLLNRFASDSFTYYLPEEYVAQFEQELSGESSDSVLGIRFSPFWTDTLVIGDLATDGAAKAAGIRRKDRILTVNGKNAFPEDSAISWISDSIRVHFRVRRPRASAPDTQFDVVVSRAPARFSSVWFDTLSDGRGYIALEQFVDDSDSAYATGALLVKAAQALSGVVKSGGWIILDLRDNPGGELENALQSASAFVPKGNSLIRIRSRDIGRNTYGGVVSDSTYLSSGAILADRKFAVLMNSETASAAEVLISALRSNFSAAKGAVLIGQKTFGKGIGQTLMATPAGAYLRITSLEILPAGTTAYGSYDGIGISPDVASTSALADALTLTANGSTAARMAVGQQGSRLAERLQAWNRSQTGFAKAGMLAYRRLETKKLH